MRNVAERLRDAIEEKAISFRKLEKITGIPRSAIQRYVSGRTQKIPIERIEAIARGLGIDMLEFTDNDNDRPDIYERISLLAKERGIKIEELSDITELPENEINELFMKKARKYPLYYIDRIAIALGVRWQDIAAGTIDEALIAGYMEDRYNKTVVNGREFLNGVDVTKYTKEAYMTNEERVRKKKLLDIYEILNETGQNEAVKRIGEIAEVPKYRIMSNDIYSQNSKTETMKEIENDKDGRKALSI